MPIDIEPVILTYQVTLTALQNLAGQAVPVEMPADFRLTGIHGTSTGTYTINFKLPSGRMFSNLPIKNTNLIGTAAQPTAIGPAPTYKGGSVGPKLDIVDTSNATNIVEICFSGIREYPA